MNGAIRVLHVDDDLGLSEVAERFLKRADDRITVESAADAEEGLGLLDDDVDCVVSDYEMPGRNGVEFLRAVREEYPDLPFILFTGKGGEAVASDAISAGVTDYLRKQSNTDHYELLANRVVDAVEGVRTEERLQAQRRRFGILFERLTQPVVEVEYEDDEPIVQQVNPAFEEAFSYDASAIVGESLDDYIVPEEYENEAEDINRRVRDGARLESEEVVRRTADGEREFLLQNAAYDDGSGGFAIYTDVSARKERERELERLNDLFQQAQRIADIGAWETDLRTDEGWWTEQVNRIYGLPSGHDPYPGEGIEYFHPEDRPKIRAAYERAVENGEPYDLELRVTGPNDAAADRPVRWVRARGEPQLEGGEMVLVRGTFQDVTERKERERELERRNTRLNALFENFPEPTITYAYEDGDPHILDVNEAFAETFGCDEAEAVGEHVDDLIVPPERREKARRVGDRVRSGEAIDETLRRRTADGIGEFRFRNVRLPDDEEIDGYAIYADVSDRKKGERELRRQDELFRKAQDLANVGAWEWYPGREEGYYSEGVYDIYGIDSRPEKSPAADIDEFYHPEDRSKLRAAFERAVETGEPYDVEVRVIDADGNEKWVRTRGDPELEDGRCVRIRGTIRDITDRKERERELRRYEAILNEILDAAYVLDEEGRYTFVNKRLAEAYGVDSAELIGTESWTYDHVAAEHGTDAYGALIDGERTELRLETELDLPEHGSSVMDVRLTRLPRTGDFEGIVGIGRDVTTQKRREERLQRQNERLERFAGAVSHDLRTPLEVARGRVELARGKCNNDHLSTASDAIDRMNELIDDILTLAREGDSVRETEPIDLGALCSDCWENVEAPDATLLVEAESTIAADRRRLRRLLENLFRNAVEHGSTSPPSHAREDTESENASEPSVADASEDAVEHGSTSSRPKADDAVEHGAPGGEAPTVTVDDLDDEPGFYVADDGAGIPEDEHERVFERGYSTAEAGTGFGLAIVREIAEAHGWTVRATESEAGGARFEIAGVDPAA